jgi:hypothetical protein
MRSIYSGAKRVIIWLGEADYDTDYVMDYIKQLEREGFNYTSNSQEISDKIKHDLRPDKEGFWLKAYSHSFIEVSLRESGLYKKLPMPK